MAGLRTRQVDVLDRSGSGCGDMDTAWRGAQWEERRGREAGEFGDGSAGCDLRLVTGREFYIEDGELAGEH